MPYITQCDRPSHAINRKRYLKEKKNRNELSAEEAVHDTTPLSRFVILTIFIILP